MMPGKPPPSLIDDRLWSLTSSQQAIVLARAMERANIKPKLVQEARKIIAEGDAKAVSAIERGSLTVAAAYAKVRKKSAKAPAAYRERRAQIFDKRHEIIGKVVGLSRAEVDPEFEGSPLDFATKHGHVHIQTAATREANHRRAVLSEWIAAFAKIAAAAQAFCRMGDIPAVDFDEWARNGDRRHDRLGRQVALVEEAAATANRHLRASETEAA